MINALKIQFNNNWAVVEIIMELGTALGSAVIQMSETEFFPWNNLLFGQTVE